MASFLGCCAHDEIGVYTCVAALLRALRTVIRYLFETKELASEEIALDAYPKRLSP
jgi:hypothetical protein